MNGISAIEKHQNFHALYVFLKPYHIPFAGDSPKIQGYSKLETKRIEKCHN